MSHASRVLVGFIAVGLLVSAYSIGYARGKIVVQMEESVGTIRGVLIMQKLLEQQQYDGLDDLFRVKLDGGVYGYEQGKDHPLGYGLSIRYETDRFLSQLEDAKRLRNQSAIVSPSEKPLENRGQIPTINN